MGFDRVNRWTLAARHSSLEQATAMFAALDLTLADTAVGLYDAKYHYQVWRPVTAIRDGATTGNPGIVPNPNWTRSRPPRRTRPTRGHTAASVSRQLPSCLHSSAAMSGSPSTPTRSPVRPAASRTSSQPPPKLH
jgi:hypothetical protein